MLKPSPLEDYRVRFVFVLGFELLHLILEYVVLLFERLVTLVEVGAGSLGLLKDSRDVLLCLLAILQFSLQCGNILVEIDYGFMDDFRSFLNLASLREKPVEGFRVS